KTDIEFPHNMAVHHHLHVAHRSTGLHGQIQIATLRHDGARYLCQFPSGGSRNATSGGKRAAGPQKKLAPGDIGSAHESFCSECRPTHFTTLCWKYSDP